MRKTWDWFGKNLLRYEYSGMTLIVLVLCTMWYKDHGWWALLPLIIGAVVCAALEAKWEQYEKIKIAEGMLEDRGSTPSFSKAQSHKPNEGQRDE